jgi:hypothetical protein
MTSADFEDVILKQLAQDTMENVIQEVKRACTTFIIRMSAQQEAYVSNVSSDRLKNKQLIILACLNQAAIESRGI